MRHEALGIYFPFRCWKIVKNHSVFLKIEKIEHILSFHTCTKFAIIHVHFTFSLFRKKTVCSLMMRLSSALETPQFLNSTQKAAKTSQAKFFLGFKHFSGHGNHYHYIMVLVWRFHMIIQSDFSIKIIYLCIKRIIEYFVSQRLLCILIYFVIFGGPKNTRICLCCKNNKIYPNYLLWFFLSFLSKGENMWLPGE